MPLAVPKNVPGRGGEGLEHVTLAIEKCFPRRKKLSQEHSGAEESLRAEKWSNTETLRGSKEKRKALQGGGNEA